MTRVEQRLATLGLSLPAPLKSPTRRRAAVPVRALTRRRAFISGHGPQNADGHRRAARQARARADGRAGLAAGARSQLAILGSLKRALGDLDRVVAWNRAFGMVNSAPASTGSPR